jgi:hypothetical protein
MAQRVRINNQVTDKITRDLANACATVGYIALRDAYKAKSYTNRTYALHDSYGCAVYLDGVLIPETIRYVERAYQTNKNGSIRTKADGRGWRGSKDLAANKSDWATGRQALENYLKNPPRMSTKNHITMLFVAAQWYAGILESKKYSVLDLDVVKQSVNREFDKYIAPVLKKYGSENMLPALRRGLGVDYTYKDIKKSRGK